MKKIFLTLMLVLVSSGAVFAVDTPPVDPDPQNVGAGSGSGNGNGGSNTGDGIHGTGTSSGVGGDQPDVDSDK
jgi:uncharacterized membrane protein YgcG